ARPCAATTTWRAIRAAKPCGSTGNCARRRPGTCTASLPEVAMQPSCAELHCLSNFSFLRGASHPEELVSRAHALGYSALALTDECSVAGVVRAHQQAKQLGLKLIIGSEFCLADGLRLVLLAPDLEAYSELCELITLGRRRAIKGSYELQRADIDMLSHNLMLWLPPDDPAS